MYAWDEALEHLYEHVCVLVGHQFICTIDTQLSDRKPGLYPQQKYH